MFWQCARWLLEPIREHRLVVAIPRALEGLTGVVFALQPQELGQLRIAGLHLGPARPAVIGEEIAAAIFDGAAYQPAEIASGLANATLGVGHVQVHDRAGPGLARPGEKALAVLLDEADRSVDHLGLMLAEVRAHRREKE